MIKIGIISDTHGVLLPKIIDFLTPCAEVWHAGDIGSVEVTNKISSLKPLRAVWGNIDDHKLRTDFPQFQIFTIERINVLMTHIGGYPKKYTKEALDAIKLYKPQLFITGHSHILKVMYDQQYQLLHINPGAAGKYGFHQVITAIRLDIDGDEFKNLEILEIEK
jgi:hypothetical protein